MENILAPNLLDVGSGFSIKVEGLLYCGASKASLSLFLLIRVDATSSGRLLRNAWSNSWEKEFTDKKEIINKENENGEVLGVIVQLGGQTPLKIAASLEKAGVKILGTSVDAIDLAEDRKRFKELLQSLNLNQPSNGIATNNNSAVQIATEIGFPIVIRPSYVLGGRAMEIVHNHEQLQKYINEAVKVSGNNPVLIDSFLSNAIEVDVDALSDGTETYIAGIMAVSYTHLTLPTTPYV